MSKLYLVFGIHNHQPVGNFDSVFEHAYAYCYLPFFKVLAKFSKIKCNVHFSGPLWDWIFNKKKTELTDILHDLKKRNQIEFLSGGYYEPILSIIPYQDGINQLKLMNQFLKEEFGQDPQGAWLAERVWQTNLTSMIKDAQLSFTLVDDAHFRYAGLIAEDIAGYFHTEDSGKSIYLFPISKRLRYKIPFSKISETKKILKSLAKKFPDKLITIVDDGEKFGNWPYTYDWVYEKGWLEKFFSLIEENADWLETLTFSQALSQFSSEGIIYLPSASYDEMMEWVLEPASHKQFTSLRNIALHKKPDSLSFLRGGVFNNFFRKYPAVNYMHKRMLHVSKRVNQYCSFPEDREIFDHLFKAQCNCAYWHGIFGGFYLPHLRFAIYKHLIAAEKLLDEKSNNTFNIDEVDFDLDGKKEIILRSKNLIVTCAPHRGGSIEEIDSKEFDFNFVNTFTRREESYHKKITEKVSSARLSKARSIHDLILKKKNGLEKFLTYDSYRKVCLIEHLINKKASVDDIKSNKDIQTFALCNYDYSLNNKMKQISLSLNHSGENMSIKKSVQLDDTESKLHFFYSIAVNNKKILQNRKFAIEFNLITPSVTQILVKINHKKDIKIGSEEIAYADTIEIFDFYKNLRVTFANLDADVLAIPIYSVSSSEKGFEKNLQQISYYLIKELKAQNDFSFSLSIDKI